jgi:branched-chain amino acid transport system permease protein
VSIESEGAVPSSPEGAQIEDEARIAAAAGEVSHVRAPEHSIARGIREGILAAVVAFLMFVLLIGLKTDEDINNKLILQTRWPLLAIIVIAIGVIRFLMITVMAPRAKQRQGAKVATKASAATWRSTR